MDAIYYFGSVVIGLALLALQGLVVWGLIEAGWWLYTKATGKEY